MSPKPIQPNFTKFLVEVKLTVFSFNPRLILRTSCVNLHSSLAMQCSRTISMRTREECFRSLAYKSIALWSYLDKTFPVYFMCCDLNMEQLPLFARYYTSSWSTVPYLIMMWVMREILRGYKRQMCTRFCTLDSHKRNTFFFRSAFQEIITIMCPKDTPFSPPLKRHFADLSHRSLMKWRRHCGCSLFGYV